MATNNYYETLGVKKDSSADDIKRSYRKLARKYHPDLNPGDKQSEEKFKSINEAYAVLGDAEKRKEYDSYGKTPFGEGGYRGPTPSYEDIFEFGFGDLFSDIFGSVGKKDFQRQARQGADIVTGIDISLEEAFSGFTKKMSISRETPCASCGSTGIATSTVCPKCGGSGKVSQSKGFFKVDQRCPECGGVGRKVTKVCPACKGKGAAFTSDTINVKIPSGVEDGSTVRLRGMGNAGAGGGPAGDVRIKVTVRPHPLFERKGDDLYIKLPVTFGEAALGAKIDVPTMDGTAVMSLPQGTQGGQRLKLSGKGFPRPGGGKGDMYVVVSVSIPKGIDQSARNAIDEIEKLYGENPRKEIYRR